MPPEALRPCTRELSLFARSDLNNLVNGQAGISSDMAIHLSKASGSLEVWLGFQLNGDLAHVASQAASLKIARLDPRDISLAA